MWVGKHQPDLKKLKSPNDSSGPGSICCVVCFGLSLLVGGRPKNVNIIALLLRGCCCGSVGGVASFGSFFYVLKKCIASSCPLSGFIPNLRSRTLIQRLNEGGVIAVTF